MGQVQHYTRKENWAFIPVQINNDLQLTHNYSVQYNQGSLLQQPDLVNKLHTQNSDTYKMVWDNYSAPYSIYGMILEAAFLSLKDRNTPRIEITPID